MTTTTISCDVAKHYEAALKAAFPSGATGAIFEHWNAARIAQADQPAVPKPEVLPQKGGV